MVGGKMDASAPAETPSGNERKRQRIEAPPNLKLQKGVGGAQPHVMKALPFVSPERGHHSASGLQVERHGHASSIRTPLQVRTTGRLIHSAISLPVQDHMAATREKVRSSISAHKKHAMRQLERQYQALREKIMTEIGEAEQQFKVLQQANNSINEKTERKLQALAELAANEITEIEKARAAAISSTAQLYAKEKQKILQRFNAEIDALTA